MVTFSIEEKMIIKHKKERKQKNLIAVYEKLESYYGNQNWWPADSAFEVIIGTILAQNVSWNNASNAIKNLKKASLLDPKKIYDADLQEIAVQIRPSRFYNQKARKIKNFIEFFFEEYNGNISDMSNEEMYVLRKKLLKIQGIGEETVDSIILYACDKPIFVVDAYTKRIFSRYGFFEKNKTYCQIQEFLMMNLPIDRDLFNDFHAQIDCLGNSICKNRPNCELCPIKCISKDLYCLNYLSFQEKIRN